MKLNFKWTEERDMFYLYLNGIEVGACYRSYFLTDGNKWVAEKVLTDISKEILTSAHKTKQEAMDSLEQSVNNWFEKATGETPRQKEAQHYHDKLKDYWMNKNGGNEI